MMRAGPVVLGLLMLTAAGQAAAQPPLIVLPEPSFVQHSTAHLPLSDGTSYQEISRENDARALARNAQIAAGASHPITLGPLSMDIGSSDVGRDGKRAHFAHVQMDDFHVLGGNVSGTFDGRAATLHLSWPTGQ
jgi:hypothetical protein